MAPSPKGNGAATTARATSVSPSLFRVPAMGRNGAGSFAALRAAMPVGDRRSAAARA